jgi:hypothetical protein
MDLHLLLQKTGLPAPKMHLDMLLGSDTVFTGVMSDLLRSILPLAEQHGVPLHELGDFDSLSARVQVEIAAANAVVSVVPMVSVWSRKPLN